RRRKASVCVSRDLWFRSPWAETEENKCVKRLKFGSGDMESSFWSWFALGLSFAILIFGFWRNRNLSDRRKKEQNRRVSVAALFPLATLFLFPPYISESSPIDLQPELQEVTTTSTVELS